MVKFDLQKHIRGLTINNSAFLFDFDVKTNFISKKIIMLIADTDRELSTREFLESIMNFNIFFTVAAITIHQNSHSLYITLNKVSAQMIILTIFHLHSVIINIP